VPATRVFLVRLDKGKKSVVVAVKENYMDPLRRSVFRENAKYEMSSANEVLMNYLIRTRTGIPTETPIGFAVINKKQYAIFGYHPEVAAPANLAGQKVGERIKEAGFGFAFDAMDTAPEHFTIDSKTAKPRIIDTESVYRKRKKPQANP
jgi:hypothetical protein